MNKVIKAGLVAVALSMAALLAVGCAEQPVKDCCQANSCKDMTKCKSMAGFKGAGMKCGVVKCNGSSTTKKK